MKKIYIKIETEIEREKERKYEKEWEWRKLTIGGQEGEKRLRRY